MQIESWFFVTALPGANRRQRSTVRAAQRPASEIASDSHPATAALGPRTSNGYHVTLLFCVRYVVVVECVCVFICDLVVLRQSLSCNWGILNRLDWVVCLSLLPDTRMTSTHHHVWPMSWCWGWNSGLHSFVACTSVTEPSPQPRVLSLWTMDAVVFVALARPSSAPSAFGPMQQCSPGFAGAPSFCWEPG